MRGKPLPPQLVLLEPRRRLSRPVASELRLEKTLSETTVGPCQPEPRNHCVPPSLPGHTVL